MTWRSVIESSTQQNLQVELKLAELSIDWGRGVAPVCYKLTLKQLSNKIKPQGPQWGR